MAESKQTKSIIGDARINELLAIAKARLEKDDTNLASLIDPVVCDISLYTPVSSTWKKNTSATGQKVNSYRFVCTFARPTNPDVTTPWMKEIEISYYNNSTSEFGIYIASTKDEDIKMLLKLAGLPEAVGYDAMPGNIFHTRHPAEGCKLWKFLISTYPLDPIGVATVNSRIVLL